MKIALIAAVAQNGAIGNRNELIYWLPNDLKHFKWDTYGNLCTSFYSTDDNGMEYYNMICVKETEEDFWVCQMACAADDQAKYAKTFSLWAASVHENGK